MVSRNSETKYQYLYHMNIEELEALLKTHACGETDGDEEFLACVLDAMEQREREHPSGRIATVDQAWSDFTRFYEPDMEEAECISCLTESEDRGEMRPKLANKVKWRRVILVAAIVCIVVTLLLPPALGFQHVAQMIGSWTDGQFSFAPENTMEDSGPVRKDYTYTFLLVASDQVGGNADTMMVLTYDTVNQEAGLVSLPRDTMVDGVKESDGSSFYKLSSAYAYNGIEGLKEEVSQILGIPIDFYVKVSTNGFVKLVAAIGGVDFNVPVNMNYEDYAQDLYIHFNKGMQWLSGSDALKVACCRQNSYYDEAEGEWKTYDAYSDADIGRTETQRNLLTAVLKKALSQPGNFATYYDIFLENVQTDLEMSDLLYFAEKALYFDFSNDLTTSVLPGDSTVTYHGWAYCYELCPDKVLELVNTQGINPYTTDITADMLTIAQKS